MNHHEHHLKTTLLSIKDYARQPCKASIISPDRCLPSLELTVQRRRHRADKRKTRKHVLIVKKEINGWYDRQELGREWLGLPEIRQLRVTKDMATYSSVLAWRIPGTGEPGGLPSMGSHRVGHDWSDLAAAAAAAAAWAETLRLRSWRDRDSHSRQRAHVSYGGCVWKSYCEIHQTKGHLYTQCWIGTVSWELINYTL